MMIYAQDLIYDVWICNIICIFYVSINLRNTCMKGSHSPCSSITSFHEFGFNIEVALYQICLHLYEFYDDGEEIYDVCLCNIMYTCSVI